MIEIVPVSINQQSKRKHHVIFIDDKQKLSPAAIMLDDATDGFVKRTLKRSSFKGKKGEGTVFFGLSHENIGSLTAIGLGKLAEMHRKDWVHTGIKLGLQLKKHHKEAVSILLGASAGKTSTYEAATALLEGIHMAMYRLDEFKSEPADAYALKKLYMCTDSETAKKLKASLPDIYALTEAQAKARRCVDLPPNIANPQFMADEAAKLKPYGVEVKVLDEKQIKKEGLNLMLAVGQGAQPEDQPRLIIMKYNGGAKDAPYRALIGKGVMFDTGGYNIKPGKSMQDMKGDMAGAAAVLGAMEAIARRGTKENVIAVLGCAMNMISDRAFLTDSIYKGYNGKTVEVGHTDAEGRMVLADTIAYTLDKYKVKDVVDLATLTGAVLVALSGRYAGLFATNDKIANALQRAGDETGDEVWRLPVADEFLTKSKLADMNNDGSPYAGSSVGAAFIKQFVGKTPWAHLDIAGVAWVGSERPHIYPDLLWGTGFGVRLLTKYIESGTK